MANKGRTPPELATLATLQHGVISALQLLGLGYSRQLLVAEADRGRLLPLHQGVYAVGHRRLTWHGRCWAAVLGAEANEVGGVVWPAVASHGSAAYLWGLYRFAPEWIDGADPAAGEARVPGALLVDPGCGGSRGAGRDPGHVRAAGAARSRDSRSAGSDRSPAGAGRRTR